jgi:prepilin-type N-terminal cleavage/methylation domain-containing protein
LETGTAEIDLIKSRGIRKTSGFTIVEVLLVLALVGLMAGLVTGNAGAFIAGGNFEPPDRVLKKSVLDAVYFAGERKRSTYLSYDEQNATFTVSDAGGEVLSSHPVFKKLPKDRNRDADDFPSVSFLAVGPLAGADGGRTKYSERELTLNRLPFHSGSSVPFCVTIKFRDKEETLYFDPFSGYALKEVEQ